MATWDQHAAPIPEIDVLWITAGLGCDGDTIAMTAATQPSIEDIVLGGIPWIPKVNFHNPFLSSENGDEFLRRFHLAAEGKLDPFILVIEGSIPDETNKAEGYSQREIPRLCRGGSRTLRIPGVYLALLLSFSPKLIVQQPCCFCGCFCFSPVAIRPL